MRSPLYFLTSRARNSASYCFQSKRCPSSVSEKYSKCRVVSLAKRLAHGGIDHPIRRKIGIRRVEDQDARFRFSRRRAATPAQPRQRFQRSDMQRPRAPFIAAFPASAAATRRSAALPTTNRIACARTLITRPALPEDGWTRIVRPSRDRVNRDMQDYGFVTGTGPAGATAGSPSIDGNPFQPSSIFLASRFGRCGSDKAVTH